HDQVEAMTMGDRICVLNYGKIMQVDTPLNLYNKPANKFVAGFIGSPAMNIVEATLEKDEKATYAVLNSDNRVILSAEKAEKVQGYIGKKVWFGIRPENIGNHNTNPGTGVNFITGKVNIVEQMGNEEFIYFSLGNVQYSSRIPVEKAEKIEYGDICQFYIDVEKCYLFDYETENNITL
ncbi:MAG: sugar ABC transporter ATP-binding protein, partial [Fusobacteriaceae bacterium]